jgi:eukaryotic-like serine/threonine-protein kinase
MENNAAHSLLGITLKTGWLVKEKIQKNDNQTGSTFSVGYIVEKDGETCFLKAFDFGGFLANAVPKQGKDEIEVVDVVNEMTTAFIYERDLSKHCKDKHVTKVTFVKEAGQEFVQGVSIPVVPYLIFDLADGDVRKRLAFSANLDYAWRLKSLHDIAVGLKQLHQIEVSHQDLKPSNILVFNTDSKLGDLGRSMCRDIDGPYNKRAFSGDWNYAPPEMMYRYYEKDWNKRVFATDCYLLGSLIVFYFSGISMSALLRKHIPDNFSWENWRGGFEELKPYLEDGFSKALSEFEENVRYPEFKEDLKALIEHLCHPYPERRGHPKNIAANGSNYSLERFITRLDVLKTRAEIKLKE